MFILDMGSGNTCKNDLGYIEKMIDAVAEVDKERMCILKWQLFEKAGDNIPLTQVSFNHAYGIAKGLGFKTTASVFDKNSLTFLLEYEDIPFVKIACNISKYYLIGYVPRKFDVLQSVGGSYDFLYKSKLQRCLCCVPRYPAKDLEYTAKFAPLHLYAGISDHTTNWSLYNEYKPDIYECHFKLPDSTGLDAGDFARTPEQLAEVL